METHYSKIYSGNFIIVQRMASLLEAIGISPVIKDESESGRLAGFGSSAQGLQDLFVHNDELDKATPIIKNALAEIDQ